MNPLSQPEKAGSLKNLLFLYIQNTSVQVYTSALAVAVAAMSIWTFMDHGNLLLVNPQVSSSPFSTSFNSGHRSYSNETKQSEIASVPVLTNEFNKAKFLRQLEKKDYSGLIIHKFPNYLSHLDVPNKKQAFFQTLIPSIIIALKEVKTERGKLLQIARKMSFQPVMTISKKNISWQANLEKSEISFLLKMAKKYRSKEMSDLVNKVKGYPVSLILAQGAIESSWGTSRFAVEGNNAFGVWTWGEKGLVPKERDEGKTHKVAMYDSILDSVRAYILTLNRHYAYVDLRNYRLQTSDSLVLAEGLLSYSERREAYVDDVKQVIESNNLQYYDSFQLTASPDKVIDFADIRKQLADITAEKKMSLPSS